MRRTFVELSSFSRRIDREGAGLLEAIQAELAERFDSGSVIPGTGGLRKLRVGDLGRGIGKRGGFRIIYLDLPSTARTYLLALYRKGEKVDISPDEKRILRNLAATLKRENAV